MLKGDNSSIYCLNEYDQAKFSVMEDLVNALLAENFFDGHDSVELLSQIEWELIVKNDPLVASVDKLLVYKANNAKIYRWWLDRVGGSTIIFPVHPAFIQPYRFEASGGMFEVRLNEDNQINLKKLGPLELMQHVVNLYGEGEDQIKIDPDGADRFMNMLYQSLQQESWSLENKQPPMDILTLPSAASLLELERKATFRDRPFHPVSKAKIGWTQEEYRNYMAEFCRPIKLNWMAVQRQYLVSEIEEDSIKGQDKSVKKKTNPMDLLLTEEQRNLINAEMIRLGLSSEEFIAIPVHPWQMSSVLPKQLNSEIDQGICIPLDVNVGKFYATSSVRSLMSINESNCHIKLPLGVKSLGAVRYLSAIKLMNGQRAEHLMKQAKEKDEILKKRLFLCDESHWWAYLPEDKDLFADHPRHLSAMVRQYPSELTDDESVRLLPMSSLAAFDSEKTSHLFDEWLRIIGLEKNESSILILFRKVLLPYYEICFRLFRLGMMPEIHGQNSILIWKEGEIESILLRDHDALRLHVPWLNANGLEDPKYGLRPGYPESLYHDTPQKLLSYFQMLGIQVNSYAILESLSRYYGIQENRLWFELQECLKQAIVMADLPDEVRDILEESLFVNETWPWKQVIRPLVRHHVKVPGSMPSGQGEVRNPFKALGT